MKKLEKLFQTKIFIFDFSLICLILGVALYFILQNVFSSINFGRKENEKFNFKKTVYPVTIKEIKKTYTILENKFKRLIAFIKEKENLGNYLPLETILYTSKKLVQNNVNKTKVKKNKEVKKTKPKIFYHRKIKIFVYLRSIVYNPQNPNLSCVYLSLSDRKYDLDRDKNTFYLTQNSCKYLRHQKLNFCIDKIVSNYVVVKISTENGDKTWIKYVYPGKKSLYLEY